LPIPFDKKAVPKQTFAILFDKALNNTPEDITVLPFTSTQKEKANVHVLA